jgi:phosphomannomutase
MLMKSISGIRGIWKTEITPENVQRFAANFASYQQKRFKKKKITLTIGRDSRTTGDLLVHSAIAGILSGGADAIYLGIVATPTLLLAVKDLSADGGICITASHNPAEWNAMKFVDKNGMFLFPEVMDGFLKTFEKPIFYTDWDKVGKWSEDYEATYRHIQKILSISYLDLKSIRSRKIKVVLDSVNGAGGVISPTLLRELGCEVIELNSEPTGIFAHSPEPLEKNLKQICEEVKKHKADIGFATDPDVDRLAIIDEKGRYIGEELTLVLAIQFVLSKTKGSIVTNLSSTMAIEMSTKKYNPTIYRTAVGEINIAKKMKEIGSVIGGEGTGGVICPAVNYTRDAIVGMALLLGYMAQNKSKKLSELVDMIPKLYIAKEKIETDTQTANKIMKNVVKKIKLPDTTVDKTDGIKITGKDFWIHIRKSGTEPIIRIYAEATSKAIADSLCNEAKLKLDVATP